MSLAFKMLPANKAEVRLKIVLTVSYVSSFAERADRGLDVGLSWNTEILGPAKKSMLGE